MARYPARYVHKVPFLAKMCESSSNRPVAQSTFQINSNGRFEEIYRLQDFTIDPAVHERRDELAARPDGLILNGVWTFTHTGGPSGLEIMDVELVPPRQGVRERRRSERLGN